MAVSGSTNYSTNRDNIIKYAMLEIGVLGSGQTPSTSEVTDCSEILNAMVKHWQVQHNIHRIKDVTVTLTPGTPSYSIGVDKTINEPRPLGIISARRRDSASNEIPVEVIPRDKYMSIPTKSTQAPVNGVYYDRQRTDGTIYVWPTGSSGNTILILSVSRAIDDFDASDDEPDFPQEWFLALYKNLAIHIAPMFRRTVSELTAITAGQLLMELAGHETQSEGLQIQPKK